jgi:hypothetical protein
VGDVWRKFKIAFSEDPVKKAVQMQLTAQKNNGGYLGNSWRLATKHRQEKKAISHCSILWAALKASTTDFEHTTSLAGVLAIRFNQCNCFRVLTA